GPLLDSETESPLGFVLETPTQPYDAAAPDASSTVEHAVSPYRAGHLLGSGGMGAVYLARDESLGREVALKRIKSGRDSGPEASRRFLREAQIPSRLNHPGIVPVHTVGRDREGRPFYTMRLIPGDRTLKSAIRDYYWPTTPPADPGARRVAFRR